VTFDVGPRFAGPARDGCCAERACRSRSQGAESMKQVEKKDLPSVPGGTQFPGTIGDVGPITPTFPEVPEPDFPTVPIVDYSKF
jgi:hypothetical protein